MLALPFLNTYCQLTGKQKHPLCKAFDRYLLLHSENDVTNFGQWRTDLLSTSAAFPVQEPQPHPVARPLPSPLQPKRRGTEGRIFGVLRSPSAARSVPRRAGSGRGKDLAPPAHA